MLQFSGRGLSLSAVSSACAAVLLAACGGGSVDTEGDVASASDSLVTGATTVTSTTWTRCAVEDGSCSFTGTRQVRYGLNGKYATRTLTGPVACNNTVFGDPYPGVDKVCDYSSTTTSTTTAPAPTTSSNTTSTTTSWVRCAVEGAACTVPGTAQVRYGLNGKYATRTATNSIGCNNTVFGDPYPGVDKVCDYAKTTTTTTTPTTNTTPTTTTPTTATTTPTTSTTNPLVTDSVFAPTSFWYKPIPTSVTLHPNSANYVTEFLRQRNTYYGNVTINTEAYASPVYVPSASTPTVNVTQWDCQNKGYSDSGLASQWSSVPIPTNALPSAGTDGEMSVYSPSTGKLWEFWQMRKVNGQWQACWGGQMSNTATSSGIWNFPYGTTATGLPFIGGQITAEELQRGEIRHVIGIALVDLANWDVVSWPANRSDGYNPNNLPNRIPEGTRFRLDPSINVDALNIHPVAKIIAKAAQKYGFVVWDTAGALSLRAQNVTSYTAIGKPNPYNALFNGTPEYAVLDGFPWDKLQFLPKDYGKQ